MKQLITLGLLASIVLVGCKKEDDKDAKTSGFDSLVFGHNGVDFSAGSSDSIAWEMQDGYTTTWPMGGFQEGKYGIWYSPSEYKQRWIGPGDLSSISSIDTTHWDTTNVDHPLLRGEMWVSKCRDGYVKFKVISDAPTDSAGVASNPNWEVEVEYVFSTTPNF